jgi:iron complex outermembrane recepter protein
MSRCGSWMALCAAVAMQILTSGRAATVSPAPEAAPAEADTGETLAAPDEVIVTGTPEAIRRFDAAFAVSSLSQQQIELYGPLSSVDLFGKLPGFGAEPSGGETGNNVNVRGLPSSNFRFVAVVEDGLPFFQEAQEPFLNADELVRLDLMTERVEAVRGGTSSIFESNAPGATVNLVTRVGTDRPEGTLRLTAGDFGLYRLDGVWSGPLSNDLLLAVGGYYRVDDGPRPTGFTADQGGQVRVNLTRRFADGQLTVYAKRLDDRTVFYLPIPLADPRNPSVSLSNLINPHSGTLTSSDFRHVSMRTLNGTANGTVVNEDLGDGVHPRINTFGASLDWRIPGDWRLSNNLRYAYGTLKFNALFSLTPPESASGFLASELSRAQAAFGPQVSSLDYVLATVHGGGARIPFDPASTDGLIVQAGWWSIDNHITSFMNDLRVSKSISGFLTGSHELSASVYFSHYSLRQRRYFSTLLLEMRNNPRALDVQALNSAGNVVGTVTEDGFLSYVNNSDLGGDVTGRLWALYATDNWKIGERLTLDAGFRQQWTRQYGYALRYTTQNLGIPGTLADDAAGGPSGAIDRRWEQFSALAWTVGADYELSHDLGVFARYTSSFRTPNLTDIYTGATQAPASVSKVREVELGTKLRRSGLAAFATLFWNRFDPDFESFALIQPDGTIATTRFVGQTRTYGIELEADWRPARLFELSGSLTLQKPTFQNLAPLGAGPAIGGINGNQVERIAEVLGSVTPAVNLHLLGYSTKLYLTVYSQGRRFVDAANRTALPAYTTLDAGALFEAGHGLRLQLIGTNLTNTIGLTEGNPRVDILQGQGTSTAIYARPIFGRLFRASLTYSW